MDETMSSVEISARQVYACFLPDLMPSSCERECSSLHGQPGNNMFLRGPHHPSEEMFFDVGPAGRKLGKPVIPVATFLTPLAEYFSDLKDR